MKQLFRNAITCGLFLLVCGFVSAQSCKVTVVGKVCDRQGNGLAKVVMNDGYHFVTTNRHGLYKITADTTVSKFIAISVPAYCELPQIKGIATGYYFRLNGLTKGKTYRRDFILTRRKVVSDKFHYLAISDPQMAGESDFTRWNNETVKDMKNEVSLMKTDGEVIGTTLGDEMFNNMKLWPQYISSVENMGMTIFQCLGNHDRVVGYSDLRNSERGAAMYAENDFMQYFGPTDYSYNIGKVHVVTLNNIDNKKDVHYVERLTPDKIAWLKHDLSYIPKGSTVFLNMHAACWNRWNPEVNMRNAAQLEKVLRGYRVHVFCGHTHYCQNVDVNEWLYQHNVGAACGAWWWGNVNKCGTPNGYLIVDVDGNEVRWHYKSTGHPEDYRFRLYPVGSFRTQKAYIVANAWEYDDKCRVEWYQDGKLMGKMEQITDQDEEFLRIDKYSGVTCHTSHLFRAKPSPAAKVIRVVFINRFGDKFFDTIDMSK